jgi:hypothetical protein
LVYRKGEITKRQIEQGWPHHVAVVVPGKGLGHLLNDMHAFCADLDHKTRSELRLGAPDLALWCFMRVEDAVAFRLRFRSQVEIVKTPEAVSPARQRGKRSGFPE